MNQRSVSTVPLDHREGIEGRFALRVASGLNESVMQLPHDVTERLRFSRERALESARRSQVRAAAPAAIGQQGGTLALSGGPSIWLRLVSLMPLVMLVAGLVLIQQHNDLEQISVAAEVDAALLADTLPPDAYRDPGFAVFLQAQGDH